jgi:hypothetical protein
MRKIRYIRVLAPGRDAGASSAAAPARGAVARGARRGTWHLGKDEAGARLFEFARGESALRAPCRVRHNLASDVIPESAQQRPRGRRNARNFVVFTQRGTCACKFTEALSGPAPAERGLRALASSELRVGGRGGKQHRFDVLKHEGPRNTERRGGSLCCKMMDLRVQA